MNKREFKECFKLAEFGIDMTQEEARQACIALCGFGLEPKIATRKQCAYMINYQSMMLNGTRDSVMLADCHEAMLKFVTLID